MTEVNLDKILKAGKINAQVRNETAKQIVEGANFMDILDFCENRIIELGGFIAWAQLSPTTTAAHFSPTTQDNPICKKGDLLKLDIGVHIDGYISDSAISVLVPGGEDDQLKLDLMKASGNALKAASKIIGPGVKLKDLGAAQYSEAEALGFTTVKNLCGHNIERWTVHGGLTVPSYDNGNNTELKVGQVIAIEPFVTDGKGLIQEKGRGTIFMKNADRNTRSQQGRKILKMIAPLKTMPFATRDIEKELGRATAVLGLRDLEKQDIVRSYPPLVEVSERPVAQFEHSFYIDDKTITITKG